MTTTAQSFHGFESHAAEEAMDIQASNEYDMGNDDIDLDLDTTFDGQQLEDDVLSLQDAGADTVVEMQAASADNDDLMVDKEDEFDFALDFDVGQATIPKTTQSPPPRAGQAEHLNMENTEENIDREEYDSEKAVSVPVSERALEEDLIDYSDDENEEPDVAATPLERQQLLSTDVAGTAEGQGHPDGGENHTVTEEFGVGDADTHDQAEGATYHSMSPSQWDEGSVHDPLSLDHDLDTSHKADGVDDFSKVNSISADVLDEPTNDNEHQIQQESKGSSHELDVKQDHDAHSITISYDGTEYWLFKVDENQDGDWLLDDPSLATKPFYDLFNACRVQLGDDINVDTELGLRFDNFRALTMYEDSTACAVTSLQDLLDLYLNLHAQDGNADPESFYITLQFRPRVVSLIGELKKAVQNQIGFSGWNDQIVAGQTIFTTPFADDYNEQWEGEGPNTEGQDHVEQLDGGDHSEEHDADINHEDTESSQSHTDGSASTKATPAVHENDTKKSPHSHNEDASDAELHGDQEEVIVEDVIDYSDEEQEEEGPSDHGPTRESSANNASASSSTVDGEEAGGENEANYDSLDKSRVSENDEESPEGDYDEEELTYDTNENADADANADANADAQHEEGGNVNANDDDEDYPYDDLEREYDPNYNLDNAAQAYGGKEYSGDGVEQGGDGYYYDEPNTAFYEQDEFGLSAGTENQGEHGEQDNIIDLSADYDLAGVDDFLDLTGDAEESSAQAYATLEEDDVPQGVDHLDNEGKELHAHVATSIASPAITTSIGLEDLGSPQGLKRPIGEVDVGLADSSDAADAKRQKL